MRGIVGPVGCQFVAGTIWAEEIFGCPGLGGYSGALGGAVIGVETFGGEMKLHGRIRS